MKLIQILSILKQKTYQKGYTLSKYIQKKDRLLKGLLNDDNVQKRVPNQLINFSIISSKYFHLRLFCQ